MTTEEKIARRKLSLLELAQELRNVSKACKVMGYSRQQLYADQGRMMEGRTPIRMFESGITEQPADSMSEAA